MDYVNLYLTMSLISRVYEFGGCTRQLVWFEFAQTKLKLVKIICKDN